MDLPNEIIDAILDEVDFCDLLKYRLVSLCWNNMIKDYCSRKKSLALTYSSSIALESYCFFNVVKIKSFVQFRMNADAFLDRGFTPFIIKLFPHIEHFIFKTNKSPSRDALTSTRITFLLSHWKKICTLSLSSTHECDHYPWYISTTQHYQDTIAAAINELQKLNQLDLDLHFDTSLLGPTLARVHHLSIKFLLGYEDLLTSTLHEIGPDCTQLFLRHPHRSRLEVQFPLFWFEANVDLFNRLTHFGCPAFLLKNDESKEFINVNFLALHTLYITSDREHIFSRMSRISRIRELHVLWADHNHLCDPLDIDACSRLQPMINVHTFELYWYFGLHEMLDDNGETFCKRLALLFPNLKNLVLHFQYFKENSYISMVKQIKRNLFMFRSLNTYKDDVTFI